MPTSIKLSEITKIKFYTLSGIDCDGIEDVIFQSFDKSDCIYEKEGETLNYKKMKITSELRVPYVHMTEPVELRTIQKHGVFKRKIDSVGSFERLHYNQDCKKFTCTGYGPHHDAEVYLKPSTLVYVYEA